MSGSCVQVQKEAGVGGAKDFSDCTHFSFQVLSVSHLCSHLLDRHHVLDIILDQARGESFEHTH